jgi:hypothetical protein
VLRFQREGGILSDDQATGLNTRFGEAIRAIGTGFAALITITEGTNRIRFKPPPWPL